MKFLVALFFLLGALAIAEQPEWNHLPVSADGALAGATEITLYSIRPEPLMPPHQDEGFQGYEVLGSVVLTDAAVVESARKVIRDSVAAYDENHATCCFNPRHGLRIRTASKTFDFLLCYECAKLIIFADSKQLQPTLGVGGTPKLLNDILTVHKVPLPPPPKDAK